MKSAKGCRRPMMEKLWYDCECIRDTFRGVAARDGMSASFGPFPQYLIKQKYRSAFRPMKGTAQAGQISETGFCGFFPSEGVKVCQMGADLRFGNLTGVVAGQKGIEGQLQGEGKRSAQFLKRGGAGTEQLQTLT